MELLPQIFMAVFAVFGFSILITKLVSAATNGGGDAKDGDNKSSRDFRKIVVKEMAMEEELELKASEEKRKSKSKKKVRFALDHDEIVVVNKVVRFDVAEPSEKKQVVGSSCDLREVYVGASRIEDDLMSPTGVELAEKLPELGFGGIQNQSEEIQLLGEFLADSGSSCLSDSHVVEEVEVDSPVVGGNLEDSPVVEENRLDSPVVEENQVDSPVVEENKVDFLVLERNQTDSMVGKVDDDNTTRVELVGDPVIQYDQTEEGKSELVDQKYGKIVNSAGEDKKCVKLLCDDSIDEEEKEREGLISDEDDTEDDDWEGVERSDLEKVFAMAANYGMVDDHLQSLESDIQMQLYGLHKVAMEGPCHEAQPMALKVSARAKWNAWQRLGNMNPDEAMEQYINLLSEKVPGWSQAIRSCGVDSSKPNTTSILDTSQKERDKEPESGSDGRDLVGVSDSVNGDKQ